MGSYEVCTFETPLDEDAEALEPLDAFGHAGGYDRAKLARLYVGTRVRVVRTWAIAGDSVISTTKLSPYPNATLTRLVAGTLEIRYTVRRGL